MSHCKTLAIGNMSETDNGFQKVHRYPVCAHSCAHTSFFLKRCHPIYHRSLLYQRVARDGAFLNLFFRDCSCQSCWGILTLGSRESKDCERNGKVQQLVWRLSLVALMSFESKCTSRACQALPNRILRRSFNRLTFNG